MGGWSFSFFGRLVFQAGPGAVGRQKKPERLSVFWKACLVGLRSVKKHDKGFAQKEV